MLFLTQFCINMCCLLLEHDLCNSDHNMISFKLVHTASMKTNVNDKLDYNKGDYNKVNNFLASFKWDELFRDSGIEELWSVFHDILISGVHEFIPNHKCKITN